MQCPDCKGSGVYVGFGHYGTPPEECRLCKGKKVVDAPGELNELLQGGSKPNPPAGPLFMVAALELDGGWSGDLLFDVSNMHWRAFRPISLMAYGDAALIHILDVCYAGKNYMGSAALGAVPLGAIGGASLNLSHMPQIDPSGLDITVGVKNTGGSRLSVHARMDGYAQAYD